MKSGQQTKVSHDSGAILYDISGGGLISMGLAYFNISMSRMQLALALLAIAWLPLAVLTFIDGTFIGGVSMPFISDYSRQGRLLLGLPLMILVHNMVYARIPMILQYLSEVMMTLEDREQFVQGPLRKAKVYSNSIWMQIILLVLVVGVALSPLGGARFFDANAEVGSWIMSPSGQSNGLSIAGKWMQYVSIPFFQFLLVRWLWRYATWVVLMYRISRIKLKLRPTHPDGSGGLGILILAQRSFSFLFFVCGIVLSSNMVANFAQKNISFETIKLEIFGFVLLSLITIFFPLFFFTRQLIVTKYMGHLYLGKAGLKASERFEDEWVGPMSEEKGMKADMMDPSSQVDYTGVYRYLQQLSIVPIRLGDLILMALVLFIPFIPVFFMQFSIIELLEKLMGVLI